ncbi:C2H2 type zinc finger domain protein [Aspergillus udagawae]|uniref:C2H2 type zinc finger domain protein n=1 Tax=Aspergillus udagawae TaxID=91492 RepID=A0ABQ1AR74_9EURO|nr:C2H2 type zinc finger domain protein [Aspergillus udagawae]GFF86584.1 C2H2 type zinc finger domain protein [Aspergillus udagawae]GFG16675.1 C2H2 type zinc finger domain protein [Aspergillus udagawae]
MDPLNNGHINDDFNYEQDEIYTGSNIIWRAIHYTGPPVQTLGGHLAPAPTLDMSFNHSQTLFFSPVSPSSIGSIRGPAQLSGHDTGTNCNFETLEALDLTGSNLVPPEVPLSQGDYAGQWPTIRSLDAGPVQMPLEPQDAVHSPLVKVNQLKNDLQIWDSLALQALPELNHSQLIDLRSFIKTTFCKLDTSIQERLDLGAPNIPSPRDRYLCKLCSQGNRKVYGTRGTFRRHVSLTHQAEHKYYCPFDACSFSTPRRDKFRGHLQVKHGSFGPSLLNKGCLDNLARPCPPPKKCGLCPKQVTTWKRYFECITKHCRLPGGSSAYSSASQSRRGSGNTGGDGADFGGQQFFGPSGNDGSGFPPSSSFEGDNVDGREFDFNSIGQQFSFHGASLSQHNTLASIVADTVDEAEQSPPHVTNAHARTRPNSVQNKDGPKHLSPVRSPTSLRDYHRTLSSTLKEGSPVSTKSDSSLDSFQQSSATRNTPHSLDSPGRSHTSNERPRPTDENTRKNQSRELEKSCETKCGHCGHTVQSCTHCKASNGAARKCHLCAAKAHQRSNQLRPWHQERYPDHAHIPRRSLSPPWKLGRELDLTSEVFQHELFLQESTKKLSTKSIISATHPASIFPYAVSQETKSLLVLHNNLQSHCLGILTAKLESYGNRPFLPCSQGSHARSGTYNTRTSWGLLKGHDILTHSAVLMSEMATQPCITLTGRPATLSIASVSHALGLSTWTNVPDGVAIARKKLPLFRTEIQMQLLDDAFDSANPDLTATAVILRRRSHMLQTRLRVIVKLLKLKMTVTNVIELEAPEAHVPRTSQINPEYHGLVEFRVDLPMRDDALSLSQLWSMMIGNAGMIVGSFASTALDIPNLNDGRDDLQFLFMMLVHILMKFAGAPIRPLNTMLVE